MIKTSRFEQLKGEKEQQNEHTLEKGNLSYLDNAV
jgi:hypothetical protein